MLPSTSNRRSWFSWLFCNLVCFLCFSGDHNQSSEASDVRNLGQTINTRNAGNPGLIVPICPGWKNRTVQNRKEKLEKEKSKIESLYRGGGIDWHFKNFFLCVTNYLLPIIYYNFLETPGRHVLSQTLT